MRRREFITLLGASVAWPFAAMAQEPGRTYRLGVLVPDCRDTPARIALFDEVKRLGFVEGVNFARECREFGGKSKAASEYAAALVKSKVDVIYALGDTAIRAAQGATSTIPILGSTNDMVEAGLVGCWLDPVASVKGFGCRPHTAMPRTPAAGVRKPPREETAIGEGGAVPRGRYGDLSATAVGANGA